MSSYYCRNCQQSVEQEGEHIMQSDCIKALANTIRNVQDSVDELEYSIKDIEYSVDDIEYKLSCTNND